ncbi:MAG: HD-GYP domain-containing protein [Bryobacterales bacterium]|nr:HD-GYP domain-containing protein [Bryobacterales bacterium]
MWSFLPFAILLTGSFWFVQRVVVSSVRDQFRASARETQVSMAKMRRSAEQRNTRVLRIVVENPALKNGLQLLLSRRGDDEARRTVEDQLEEMGAELGFDYLVVSDTKGQPLAGMICGSGIPTALDPKIVEPARRGFFTVGGKNYEASVLPIEQGNEVLGTLTVGEPFNLASLPTPAILLEHGKVVESSAAGLSVAEIESGIQNCGGAAECELRLHKTTYSSFRIGEAERTGGYELRSIQNLDNAARPVQARLQMFFLVSGILALTGAFCLSSVSTRSIVHPIARVVARLRNSEKTGQALDFRGSDLGATNIQEIRELTEAFNRAGAAIREGQERLSEAVVEFIESLANALDARDPYTAGHSRRVSQYACAIARSMQLPPKQIEEIRVGALLHDIGKIGIADNILQKPGKLSEEENRAIQEHPTIGRKILESVQGFQPYLPIVELHHENWDGTGYPRGLRHEDTPLAARIVKIADAYDAMTSDRPYRRGMRHEEALAVIARFSGTQMDPGVVDVFLRLSQSEPEFMAVLNPADSLARLAEAVGTAVKPGRLIEKEVA